MATAKKVAAKAAPKEASFKEHATKINDLHRKYTESVKSAKALKDRATRLERESRQTFDMPVEVRDWIEQAGSRLKSLQSKVDRLELENKELKSYKRWAEHKILGSSPE